MYAEGHLEDVNRVRRLTPRQRRQVASLYGKAPWPIGTWEPLPSLTREETDVVLKEFEQQMKGNEATPVFHNQYESSDSLQSELDQPDRSLQHMPSHMTKPYSSNPTKTLSSPSLLQRSSNSAIERGRPVTECVQSMPPYSSSARYHTQVHSHCRAIQTTQQVPSTAEHHTSRSNWNTSHLTGTVYEQQQKHTQLQSQTMRTPLPNNQQYGPPSGNNLTASHETNNSLLSSQLHVTEMPHYTTADNRVPSPSCMTTLNRPPLPYSSSSPESTDYQMSSTTWTRPTGSVNYGSTQVLPSHSTSSCYNHSSQTNFQIPSSRSHSVSQLNSDLTSLSITLNPSCIEDVTNVDYSLLVVGVTGSGKSSACNFFIGSDVFNTAAGAIAVTAKSDAHVQNILGKRVLFIDTPGFGDEFASDEVRMAELGRAILFAREGVNAIVLCMDGSRRFDSSVAQLLNEFEVLGAFWPYTFILYTHAADMGRTEEEQKFKISQWLSSPRCPERMKWLFDKVCHRCMTVESEQFENNTSYYQHKSQELLNMVEVVSAQNQHQRYTNQFFQWAKRKYDQVKQQKLEHERKLEETQRNLQNYQSFVTRIEKDLQQKEQHYTEFVTKQQQYINSLQAQLMSCREEERMRLQVQRAEAQQQLSHCVQDHQRVVNNYGASKEKMLAKYDEDSQKCQEHEWQSRRAALELYLDELRFELYASNRGQRELNDKLACMNAKLQEMQEEKARPQKKEGTSMFKDMAVDGAKAMVPAIAKAICSLM